MEVSPGLGKVGAPGAHPLPLRAYYQHQIKRRGFPGRNPADDLTDFMVPGLSRRARQRASYTFFEQEEGPTLFRACEDHFPRWLPFLGVCTLGGLRWGEAAALRWADIDSRSGKFACSGRCTMKRARSRR